MVVIYLSPATCTLESRAEASWVLTSDLLVTR